MEHQALMAKCSFREDGGAITTGAKNPAIRPGDRLGGVGKSGRKSPLNIATGEGLEGIEFPGKGGIPGEEKAPEKTQEHY